MPVTRAQTNVAVPLTSALDWHGMFEVAERFYMELIPTARELAEHAAQRGMVTQARNVERVIDEILARPEHAWFQEGATEATQQIRKAMQERYGQRR